MRWWEVRSKAQHSTADGQTPPPPSLATLELSVSVETCERCTRAGFPLLPPLVLPWTAARLTGGLMVFANSQAARMSVCSRHCETRATCTIWTAGQLLQLLTFQLSVGALLRVLQARFAPLPNPNELKTYIPTLYRPPHSPATRWQPRKRPDQQSSVVGRCFERAWRAFGAPDCVERYFYLFGEPLALGLFPHTMIPIMAGFFHGLLVSR